MSIRAKILAAVAGLAAVFVVLSAVYLGLIVEVRDQAELSREHTVPHVQAVNEVRVHGLILVNTAVRIANEATMETYAKLAGFSRRSQSAELRKSYSQRRQGFQAAIAVLEDLIGEHNVDKDHHDELNRFEYVIASAKHILEQSDVLIALASRGADPVQIDEVVRSYAAVQGSFSKTIDVAALGELEEVEYAQDALGRKVRTTIVTSVLAILGAILVAVFAGRLIAARIADPIQQLNAAAKRFGEGDFTATVNVSSRDEIGQLASTFNKMRDDLKDAMDKAARSNRLSMLGQVAGTVSHELRNPLGAIKASLAVIRQLTSGRGLGLDRSLDRADRAVGRCDGIIADMLEYTRTRDMNRAPADIDNWLGGILDEHSLPATVTLSRDLRAQCQVAIDGERFRQVLVNLLDNAAQAMTDAGWELPPGRERRITVRTEVAGPHLKLSIIDTGPGIPETARAKVFEPLFTTKSFGVGLGLPTVQKIIEQHGGTIDVASTGPEGTEFVIWLPRQTETDDSTTAQAAA